MADIYVGEDGKLHKVQGGADSVLPFKSSYTVIDGSVAVAQNTYATINVDKKPLCIIASYTSNKNVTGVYYNFDNTDTYLQQNGWLSDVTDSTFKIRHVAGGTQTMYYKIIYD